jgi:hypothetical protein
MGVYSTKMAFASAIGGLPHKRRVPIAPEPQAIFFGSATGTVSSIMGHRDVRVCRFFWTTPCIFLDNAFHFFEDVPVVLVSFVLWDSVRVPRERPL